MDDALLVMGKSCCFILVTFSIKYHYRSFDNTGTNSYSEPLHCHSRYKQELQASKHPFPTLGSTTTILSKLLVSVESPRGNPNPPNYKAPSPKGGRDPTQGNFARASSCMLLLLLRQQGTYLSGSLFTPGSHQSTAKSASGNRKREKAPTRLTFLPED